MPEKEPQFFETPQEERSDISLERWAEEQALDFIIQKTRARRLRMEDFARHYGEDTIAEDRAVVEALKRKFDDELQRLPAPERERLQLSQKRGEALEIIITEQGELSDWFGPDAMTTRTAEIDDYRNKVDIIIEFSSEEGIKAIEENAERIALAIDASDDPSRIRHKASINKETITGKRTPAHVRYFRSQVTNYEGPINKIIPVIVGLDGKNMQGLARLQRESLAGKNSRAAVEQLAGHPAQRVFIEQIKAQLVWYLKLLEKEKPARPTYERKDIEGLLAVIEELAKEKKLIPLGELEEDRVSQEIQRMIE